MSHITIKVRLNSSKGQMKNDIPNEWKNHNFISKVNIIYKYCSKEVQNLTIIIRCLFENYFAPYFYKILLFENNIRD